jgi:hypothetical protein
LRNGASSPANTAVATGGAVHCEGTNLCVFASTFSANKPPAVAMNNIPLVDCVYAIDQGAALRKGVPPGGTCDRRTVEVDGVIDEMFANAFELPRQAICRHQLA